MTPGMLKPPWHFVTRTAKHSHRATGQNARALRERRRAGGLRLSGSFFTPPFAGGRGLRLALRLLLRRFGLPRLPPLPLPIATPLEGVFSQLRTLRGQNPHRPPPNVRDISRPA